MTAGLAVVVPDVDGLTVEQAAYVYADAGLPVFLTHGVVQVEDGTWRCQCAQADCANAGKHPLTRVICDQRDAEHRCGIGHATTDRATLAGWLARSGARKANLAVAVPPGVLVIDGDDPDQVAAWEGSRGVAIPRDVLAITGRDPAGWHAWVAYSGDARGTIAGADLRAGGAAYVVVPPSRHVSGRPYRWARTGAVPAAPPALASALAHDDGRNGAGGPGDFVAGGFVLPDVIPQGRRHELLVRYAGKLRRELSDADLVAAAVADANRGRCRPPLSDRELGELVADAVKRWQPAAGDGEDVTVTPAGLGVRATLRGRELVVRPGVGAVRVTAFADGALIDDGEAAERRIGDRSALARHLADTEGQDSRREWMRVVAAALAALDASRGDPWLTGAGTDDDDSDQLEAWRVFPMIRCGLDSVLLAGRSRMKTTLALAAEVAMLAGVPLVPGVLDTTAPADHVLHVNAENDAATVRRTVRRVAAGLGVDPAVLDDRWHLLPMAGVPRLDRLAELIADYIDRRQLTGELHLTMDSALQLIATMGSQANGDTWSAGAAALLGVPAGVRSLTGRASLSGLILDHVKAKATTNVDSAEDFLGAVEYGSQRKADLARAAYKLGVMERGEDADGTSWAIVSLREHKAWPDWAPTDDRHLLATFGTDRSITFRPSDAPAGYVPAGIKPGSVAATIVAVLRQEGQASATRIADQWKAVGGKGDVPAVKVINQAAGRHGDVFQRAADGSWKLR